jgi:hypothetical protein
MTSALRLDLPQSRLGLYQLLFARAGVHRRYRRGAPARGAQRDVGAGAFGFFDDSRSGWKLAVAHPSAHGSP